MVTADGQVLVTGEGFKDARRVGILFEESFYNARDQSYRVLCTDGPLQGGQCAAATQGVSCVRLRALLQSANLH